MIKSRTHNSTSSKINQKINKIIQMLGITPGSKGFYCLREAIKLTLDKGQFFPYNQVYLQVYDKCQDKIRAKVHNEDPAEENRKKYMTVYRGIKKAVDDIWYNSENKYLLSQIFVNTDYYPGNAIFIEAVARYVCYMD